MAPTRSRTTETQKKIKYSKQSDAKSSPSSMSPGVQKIKSSLRQTRRLLAKRDLAADVRIETERRLKSLESDLARAERTRKERNFAVKYHKIKFFERQKICRKIKHAKKELGDTDLSPGNLAALRETLFSHRIDLNYILHYPKTKKYISLFPPEGPEGPEVASGTEISDTDDQREEIRRWVRSAMERGEMDTEPEITLNTRRPSIEGLEWEEESRSRSHNDKKEEQKELLTRKRKGVPGDAFFEASDTDDQVQSNDG